VPCNSFGWFFWFASVVLVIMNGVTNFRSRRLLTQIKGMHNRAAILITTLEKDADGAPFNSTN
jgi:hypothetical protein